jgi:hypothetical protein
VLGVTCFVLLAASKDSSAATRTAASCSSADVQAALTSAFDGDTVVIPAGTCVWNVEVVGPSGRGLRVVGAGIGRTIIKRGLALRSSALTVHAPAGSYAEVTGITCDSQDSTATDANCMTIQSGSVQGQNTFRVHHNEFTNIDRRGLYLAAEGVISSGLVDHNTFWCITGSACQAIAGHNCDTGDGPSTVAMSTPMGFGGPIQNYIEDNVFNAAKPQDGSYDNYSCGRGTMRFNTMHGFNMGHHGTEIRRGTQMWEYYFNTIDMSTFASGTRWSGRWVHHRTGTGFMFGNTAVSGVGTIEIYYYRMSNTVPKPITHFHYCTPNNPYDSGPYPKDGRLGGTTGSYVSRPVGYPCLDQTGWWFDHQGGDGGTFYRAPAYIWNNRRAGSLVHATVDTDNPVGYHVENFDYFNQNTSFNGTSGIGVGTRSQMDAITTCAEWTGFWVEDEGEWNSTNGAVPDGQLYACRSNRWVLYYKPYTYPHPLQSGPPEAPAAGPPAPRSLRIISSE